MSGKSGIEWTDYTFNAWWGCEKVTRACKNCYAERLDKRFNGGEHWGPGSDRKMQSEDYWQKPVSWNDRAKSNDTRYKVFANSMADVFEDHTQVEEPRRRLWDLIERTPYLDWLLLTKRPENIARMIPDQWLRTPPGNVWYGVSVETQEQLVDRVPILVDLPAVVRFLSCEPLLGQLDLGEDILELVDWVIAGGESGTDADPTHPDYVRYLRDQCLKSNVPFHFKQWGAWLPSGVKVPSDQVKPSDLENADVHAFRDGGVNAWRVGKDEAGRHLDGRTWDQEPEPEFERFTDVFDPEVLKQ